MKLIYTAKAVGSLTVIRDFIAQYNNRASEQIINQLLDRASMLSRFAKIGAVDRVIDDSRHRSLVVSRRYKIIYRIEDDIIYIIDVWDCRQNPKSLKRRIK